MREPVVIVTLSNGRKKKLNLRLSGLSIRNWDQINDADGPLWERSLLIDLVRRTMAEHTSEFWTDSGSILNPHQVCEAYIYKEESFGS